MIAPNGSPLFPGIQIVREGRWVNADGSALTYEELMEVAMAWTRRAQEESAWLYSHCELEGSLGGENANKIRNKVMERRAAIDASRDKANDPSPATWQGGKDSKCKVN